MFSIQEHNGPKYEAKKERKAQKLIMKIFHYKVSVLCIKEPASVP